MSGGVRKVAALSVAVGLMVGLAAASCDNGAPGSAQQVRDLEGVLVEELGNPRIVANVDGFPNVVAGCIEGAAFLFTTRDYQSVMRAPDLDAELCGTRS